jgi:hypothetical protein
MDFERVAEIMLAIAITFTLRVLAIGFVELVEVGDVARTRSKHGRGGVM